MNYYLKFLSQIFIFCISNFLLGQSKIKILNSDEIIFDKNFNSNVKKLIGNVICYNNDFKIYCDSAYLYGKENKIESFSNIKILKGKILAEGAQGSLLDIDFGTYPFVTSSNTISAGACTGLGIPPNKIGKIFGIFKAYLTRVGSGPFPTEQDNDIGEKMKKNGNEFGSTTGRSRRCGWIDIPALKYAIKINGVSELMLMKSDVLSKFPYINVCTGYKYKNKLIDYFPYSIDKENIQPVYQKLNSWDKNIQNINVKSDLPKEALKYVEFLENTLKIPISIISVGPNRNQTIINNFKT